MNVIFQFLGYTFAFWMAWKVWDKIYHVVRGDPPPPTGCSSCNRREGEIQGLQEKNESLELENEELGRRNKSFGEELAKKRPSRNLEVQLYRERDELLAIKILNVAGEGTLNDIYGIGPVKAKRIMEARPFYSWKDVEKTVPGFKRYIITWAKKWEPSFTHLTNDRTPS